jgi:uncharacterized protein
MKMGKTSAILLGGLCAVALFINMGVGNAQQPANAQQSKGGPNNGNQPDGYRTPSIVNGVQIQTPMVQDVISMEDSLPLKAPARPKQARKVLVLAKARGYAHSSIPLAAATIKAMGDKTDAWTTTITYDAADINENNLKQYDLVFLDSTTGAFLDEPDDATVTAARRKALLDFVRSGKGLAGIHAATDSYHTNGGGGRGRGAKAGDPAPAPAPAVAAAPAKPTGTWPEFNTLIGGFFKYHWVFPQPITVKIDDPKSPLTAMFHGQEFNIHDEVYTYAQDSYSRKNLHILTSIDYSKMSDADKAKEPEATRRTDGDYGLSWIRREGKGRVFYEALGHSEHIYSRTPMLEHILAGVQYALGDLAADDSPSAR